MVIAPRVTQAANDKEQLAPMLTRLKELPKELGRPKRMLTDSGYLSEKNVEACAAAGIEPLIALGRERHHRSWRERFAETPQAPRSSAKAMEKMRYRLKTPAGRKLYALRKQTPEPVFGIIKSAMDFRQFLLRGFAVEKDCAREHAGRAVEARRRRRGRRSIRRRSARPRHA